MRPYQTPSTGRLHGEQPLGLARRLFAFFGSTLPPSTVRQSPRVVMPIVKRPAVGEFDVTP